MDAGVLVLAVQQSPITKQFTDNELCTLAWLWRAGNVMLIAYQNVTHLLQDAEHGEAGHFTSIEQEYPQTQQSASNPRPRNGTCKTSAVAG